MMILVVHPTQPIPIPKIGSAVATDESTEPNGLEPERNGEVHFDPQAPSDQSEFGLPGLGQVRERLEAGSPDPEPVLRQLVRVFIDERNLLSRIPVPG